MSRIARLACLLVFAAMCAATSALAAAPPDDGKLRIVVFGAHPDDAEYDAGGCGAKWAKQGHHVLLCSVTNGDIGHWQMAGGPLAIRRTDEVAKVSKVLGTHSRVLDIHDGELEPNLENRKKIIRVIRQWKADVVISHRPWDYHPDHRYVGVLVQDAAYMVAVPHFCPDSPPLKGNPVFLYSSDNFIKPYRFKADIVVALDDVIETKFDALHELESQVYEGGALGSEEQFRLVPKGDEARKKWFRETHYWAKRDADVADKYRDELVTYYGSEKGKKVKYAEAFEVCEYGRRVNTAEIKKLFPFYE